jgi:hypothetical protein
MRRPPNPYRVLAHALDVGDRRLAEALTFRLAAVGLSGPRQGAAAEATVERLNAALELIEVLERLRPCGSSQWRIWSRPGCFPSLTVGGGRKRANREYGERLTSPSCHSRRRRCRSFS